MSHPVKCKYCSSTFDRDKLPYVKISSSRYAHASCYLREKEDKPSTTPTLEIVDPTTLIECSLCKKIIDKKKDEYVQLPNKKYAHKHCAELEEHREKTDLEQLDIYLINLFGWEYISPRIRKQINHFIKEYNFTYSGIRKSMQYFYEIKGNPIEKANNGLGIVPYIYQDAYRYFYTIWEAQQKNLGVKVEDYIPTVQEIVIPPPQVRIRSRRLFKFLDEDGD